MNHEINGKMDSMKIVDDNRNENSDEKILRQYAWVPPGLEANLVRFHLHFQSRRKQISIRGPKKVLPFRIPPKFD